MPHFACLLIFQKTIEFRPKGRHAWCILLGYVPELGIHINLGANMPAFSNRAQGFRKNFKVIGRSRDRLDTLARLCRISRISNNNPVAVA